MQCQKMKNISPSYKHDSIIRRFIVKGSKGKNYSFRRSTWVGLRLVAGGDGAAPAVGAAGQPGRGGAGGAPGGGGGGGGAGGGRAGAGGGRRGGRARPAAGFCEAAAELE
jgi:hypothetical protein